MTNRVTRIDDLVKVKNALISVADKRNLESLIPRLLEASETVRLYSTGGTYQKIREILGPDAEGRLIRVSDYTGQPEMQGGLVKTLDYRIYLGLLSETYNPEHKRDLERSEAVTFDLVVVNLYPFGRVTANPGVTCEEARAHIDIGGPCMLRAAAKNFLRVAAVCDPDDYDTILEEMHHNGGATSVQKRFQLAQKAFSHTAHYDTAITDYLMSLTPKTMVATYSTGER